MNELHEPAAPYDTARYKHSGLTRRVIGIFYDVYNTLGYGFLEKVYENALAIRLEKAGFIVAQQRPIKVYFDGQVVGEYFADLVVNDLIILEVKAVQKLAEEHEAQLINYLKATPYEVGLLLNPSTGSGRRFGPEPQVIRKAYDNRRKKNRTQMSRTQMTQIHADEHRSKTKNRKGSAPISVHQRYQRSIAHQRSIMADALGGRTWRKTYSCI